MIATTAAAASVTDMFLCMADTAATASATDLLTESPDDGVPDEEDEEESDTSDSLSSFEACTRRGNFAGTATGGAGMLRFADGMAIALTGMDAATDVRAGTDASPG